MINKALFTSQRQNWRTPKRFYEELNKEFNFNCDPCLLETDTIHDKDMLGSEWGSCCFVNPPYKDLAKWIKKGYEEYLKGKTIVFLIPARTDTKYFHDYCLKAKEIRFIKGRLCFDDSGKSAPFPSCLIIFKK